jgi:hypothetical protein
LALIALLRQLYAVAVGQDIVSEFIRFLLTIFGLSSFHFYNGCFAGSICSFKKHVLGNCVFIRRTASAYYSFG